MSYESGCGKVPTLITLPKVTTTFLYKVSLTKTWGISSLLVELSYVSAALQTADDHKNKAIRNFLNMLATVTQPELN